MGVGNIIIGSCAVEIGGDEVGYTKGGVSIRYEPDFVDIMADQGFGTVLKRKINEKMFITTTFLEVSQDRIMQAFGMPSSSQSGSTLTFGTLNATCGAGVELEIGLTGVGPDCGVRTFFFGRCVAIGTREYKMSVEDAVMFEVEFECLKDASGHFGTCIDSSGTGTA